MDFNVDENSNPICQAGLKPVIGVNEDGGTSAAVKIFIYLLHVVSAGLVCEGSSHLCIANVVT